MKVSQPTDDLESAYEFALSAQSAQSVSLLSLLTEPYTSTQLYRAC